MLHRVALALALALAAASLSSSPEAATEQSTTASPAWQRTETQHFEVHFPAAIAPDVDPVVRSAERAYDRISGRLSLVLPTRVLLIVSPSRDQAAAYGMTSQIAPRVPHRNRLVIAPQADDAQLDAVMVHELTHALVSEIIMPGVGGDSGVPAWILEGVAEHMAGIWREDEERLVREVVASGGVPALSQLRGDGGFASPRLNHALGHAAFDYIESRWGATRIRPFLDAFIVTIPRAARIYEAVFEVTPAEFDEGFRQYVSRRFGNGVR